MFLFNRMLAINVKSPRNFLLIQLVNPFLDFPNKIRQWDPYQGQKNNNNEKLTICTLLLWKNGTILQIFIKISAAQG